MVSVLLEAATSVAGMLMGAAHLPQAYRVWRHKSSHDVSIAMYSLFLAGAYIWFAYGLATRSVPIILSFGVSVVSITLAFVLVLRYRNT